MESPGFNWIRKLNMPGSTVVKSGEHPVSPAPPSLSDSVPVSSLLSAVSFAYSLKDHTTIEPSGLAASSLPSSGLHLGLTYEPFIEYLICCVVTSQISIEYTPSGSSKPE